MARLRRNFQSGFVSGPLPATGATATLYSPELANLPVATTTDYVVLVLDPNGEYGAPEIVWLTAHSANATSGTITRAQESTVARVHPLNTRWINALSAADLDLFITSGSGNQTMTGQFTIIAGSATTVAEIVRGAASQTANLTEWRNSASAIQAQMGPTGHFRTLERTVAGSLSVDPGATVNAVARTATERGLIVRAAASPTVNIAEFQNSAGTPLFSVSSAGAITSVAGITGTVGTFTAQSLFSVGTFTDPDVGVTRAIKAGPGGIAVLGGTKTDTLTVTGSSTISGPTTVNDDITINGAFGNLLGAAANTHFVQAAASHTANIFEVRNSAGTVLSRIDASGLIFEGANRVYSAATPNLAAAVTTANTYGLAAVLGTGTTYARADHHHGTPPAQTITGGTGITATLSGVNYTLANTGATSVAGRTGAVVLTAADIAAGTFPGTAYTFTGTVAGTAFLANSDGTIAAPAFRFGSASNTGLYSPGTDIVGLAAGGLEVFRATNAAGVLSTIVTGTLNTTGIITENGVRVYSATTPNLAATVTTANTYGLASVLGTGTTYARADHHHGTPPAQTIAVSGSGITATLSGVNYTLANTGVTSNVAGGGISVSGATGAVTITNTGVLSVTASGNLASSGGQNPAISIVAAPTFTSVTSSTTNPTFVMTDGTNTGRIGVASAAGSYASGSVIGDVVIRGDNVSNTQGIILAAGPSSTNNIRVTSAGSTISGAVSMPGTLAVTGATTFTGLTTHTGGVTTPADITISGTGGQLNLSASGGTVAGTGTGIGDKINMYNATYGFGIQTSRLVAFVESTAGFSVRQTAGAGNKSSGTDAHTFLANGNATHTGTLTVNSTSTFTGRTTHSQGSALTAAAATVVLDVLGAASPTADLAQFRTATGLISRFGPDGSLNVNATSVTNNALKVASLAAGGVASIFQGAASQTADLTQWQNSSASVIASVDYIGRFMGVSANLGGFPVGVVNLGVTATSATTVPSAFRGTVSQTADLTQWQNSAGTVLSRVYSTGNFQSPMIGVGTTPGTYTLSVTSTNNDIVNMTGGGRTFRIDANGMTFSTVGTFGRQTWGNQAMLEVYNNDGTPARKGLYIQGAVGQTGDLIDLRDSAGVQVARIDSAGVATFSGQVTSNGSIEAVSDAPNVVTFSARGAVGQTANLTEWRDSASSVLSYVNSAGNMFIGGSQVVTNATLPSDIARTGSANTFTAANLFSASGPTIIPVSVRGAASQTGDLTQWQNNTAAVLMRVFASGTVATANRIVAGDATAAITSQLAVTNTQGTSSVVSTIRGMASQSGDLTQWQDSAGAILARVTGAGGIGTATRLSVGTGTGTVNTSSILYVNTVGAANVGAIIQGVASQTGDALQIQGSDGTVWARFDANMTLSLGGTTGLGSELSIAARSATQKGMTIRGAASQTADLTQWTNSANTILLRVNSSGELVNADSSLVVRTTGTAFLGNSVASNVGLTVKGATSQTADLTQWQNSTGSVFSRIKSDGTGWFNAGQFGPSDVINASSPNPALFVSAPSAARTAIVARAAASQTATIQEWQNSAGSALAAVMSNGRLEAYQGSLFTTFAAFKSGAWDTFGAQVAIQPTSTGVLGLIVRGAASQTADLTQWQDSAGAITGRILPNGDQYLVNPTPHTNGNFVPSPQLILEGRIWDSAAGNSAMYGSIQVHQSTSNITAPTSRLVFRTSWDGVLEDRADITGEGTFRIFGRASQTADLTQWQNSAGSVLARISSDGRAIFDGGATNGHTALFRAPSAAVRGIVAQGAASQTANLQEWQNSTGTVLASVGPAGRFAAADGSVTAPGFRFQSDTDTGIYRVAADQIGFAVAGVNRLSLTASGLTSTVPLTGTTSFFTAPTAATVASTVRGAASQTANLVTFQNSAGAELSSIGPAGRFTAPAGDAANPGLRFLGDTNTGIYRPIADSVAITTAGALSTEWDATNRQWQHGNLILATATGKLIKNVFPGTQTGTNKIFDHIVAYTSNSANVTGAIQFTAPYPATTNMMQKLSIEGYTYDSNGPLGIELGFYNTTNTTTLPTIVNSGFSSEGSLKPTVRVGYSPAAIADMPAPTLSTATTGGTLAAATYNYRVTALVQGGETQPLTSAAITTTGTTSTVTVTWTAVSGATGYRVWRGATAGSELLLATLGVVTTYTDTGAVTPAGAMPVKNSTMDASKVVITLGDTNTVWQYPKFFITRAISTHGTAHTDTTMDGWTSALVTSFSGIGQQVTVANKDGIFQNITVTAATASGVPAIFRGATSQSGDLTQWQNSAATTIASVTASGAMTFTGTITGNGKVVADTTDTYLRLNQSNQFTSGIWLGSSALKMSSSATSAVYIGSNGGNDGNVAILTHASDNTRRITLTGATGEVTAINLSATSQIRGTYEIVAGNNASGGGSLGALSAYAWGASIVGFAVRGFASQTADLSQWQNSAGTVLARINSAGDFAIGSTGIINGASTSLHARGPAERPLVVRGAASQTVNLTEWQTSAGTVTSFITEPGFAGFGGATVLNGSNGNSSTLSVHSTNVARTNLVVRAMASQTANIAEFQNSAGTVLARFNENAALVASRGIQVDGGINGTSTGPSLLSIAGTATNIPVVARGVASQSANLQEWQNSAGTVLASVKPDGAITSPTVSDLANFMMMMTGI